MTAPWRSGPLVAATWRATTPYAIRSATTYPATTVLTFASVVIGDLAIVAAFN